MENWGTGRFACASAADVRKGDARALNGARSKLKTSGFNIVSEQCNAKAEQSKAKQSKATLQTTDDVD